MLTTDEFAGCPPTWCPGCGNWGILISIKAALKTMGLLPSYMNVVFGIGCSGNMNDFLNAYAVHSLHGRAIPTAIGIKLANHKTPVVVIAGDGDCYGEGGNHFLHACRGNHDITVITHNNNVYGLTTGQVAPTARKGYKSKSTPDGIIEQQLNPLLLAIISGATFVAQAFAGDTKTVAEIVEKGIEHKGFSLVNILQPCVTFNKINTYQYYLQRVYKLDTTHDKTDYKKAMEQALDVEVERFPIGVLYEQNIPSYHEQLVQLNKDDTLYSRKRFEDFTLMWRDFR